MPGSQLKRLKASLREQGVIGPQQSKKQKRRNAQDGKANNTKRLQKAAALEGIREQFNPFDLKHNVRGPKFEVTSNRPATGNAAKGIHGRPADAKALGEERRRQTLLVEMNRRHKAGGILDRRFGENDPTMTPEEKMLQRFVREKQSHARNSSLFDLEEDEPNEQLTHFGKSLSLDGPNVVDDFDEEGLEAESDDELSDGERGALKRMRPFDAEEGDGEGEEGQPERKKTKQEVMKEVIAKSKFHKAERQAAKDEDEDLREEIDKELPDLHALLFTKSKPTAGTGVDGVQEGAATVGKEKMERDYDLRLRQLAQDRRGMPTERTKTEEEQAREDLERLKSLEESRLRRMRGEQESDSEDENQGDDAQSEVEPTEDKALFTETEDDNKFGLGAGIRTRPTAAELGLDDEDSFYIEDDLLASGSDLEPVSDEESDEGEESNADEDDEFTKGLLNEKETQDPVFANRPGAIKDDTDRSLSNCPQTLDEFLEISRGMSVEQIPTVVQRIRLQYHPKLDSGNKSKLANFSTVLPQYLKHLSNSSSPAPFSVLESLVRHIHSLAKTYPIEIANEFRSHIDDFGRSRPLSPDLGDLVILTAIGSIWPPSDHFHQITTPAMLLIARYLGQKVPKRVVDYSQGAYLGTLALQYQAVSKRWVPEMLNFSLNTLVSLAPVKPKETLGSFPIHEPGAGIRIAKAQRVSERKLAPKDCTQDGLSDGESLSTRVALMSTTVKLLDVAADLYSGKAAFFEAFQPVTKVLAHLARKSCKAELPATLNDRIGKLGAKLERMLQLARLARRPLELHHHKPLAIKLSVPKFEDSFDPNKHYDPDRDRAELAKLKAEHKKERKGAMRELRKDANFMAREKLRMKKQKDEAYEKKYKRLVAEIQGEEGREANAYEREKQMRKRASKR